MHITTRYTCPVCGYDGMQRPPEDWNICPCCLTEFNEDDVDLTHAQLRQLWVNAGAPWRSTRLQKPLNWNPISQLRVTGHIITQSDIVAIIGNVQVSEGTFLLTPDRRVSIVAGSGAVDIGIRANYFGGTALTRSGHEEGAYA